MQLNNIKISQGSFNSSNNAKNISQNDKLNLNSLFDFNQSEDCTSVLIGENSYSSPEVVPSLVDSNANGEFNILINAFPAISSFENEVQSLIINSKDNVITELIDLGNIESDNILLNQDGEIVEQLSQMLPFNILNENNDQSKKEKKEVNTKTEKNDSLPIENNNIQENLDLFINYSILADKSILNIKHSGNSVSEITNNLKVQNNIDISNYKSKESSEVEQTPLQNPIDINSIKDNEITQINKPVVKESSEVEQTPLQKPIDINLIKDNEIHQINKPVVKENKGERKLSILNKFKQENFEFENDWNVVNNPNNNNEIDIDVPIANNSKVNKNTPDTIINTNTKDSVSSINIAEENVGVVKVLENNKNKEITYTLNQNYSAGDNDITENNSNYSIFNNQNFNSIPFEQSSNDSEPISLNPNKQLNSYSNDEINNNITSDKPLNEVSDELKSTNSKRLNIKIESHDEIPKIEFKVDKIVDNKKEVNELKYDNIQNNKTVTNESNNIYQNLNSKQLQLLLSLKSNTYFPKEILSNNYAKTTNNKYSTIENLILNNYQQVVENNSISADTPTLGNNNIDVDNKISQKIEKILIDEMKPNVFYEISIPKTETETENKNSDLSNNNNFKDSSKESKLNNMNQKNNGNGIYAGVEIKQDENILDETAISENIQNDDIDTEIGGKNNSNDNKIQVNKNNQELGQLDSLNNIGKIQNSTSELNKTLKNIKTEHQLNQYTAKIYTNEFAKTTFNIISSLPENSIGTANLILKPASLGIIIVNINLKDKELNIDIRPENKDVAKSIENQIPQLKERLTGVGIQIESININDSRTEQDLAEKKQPKKEQKENNKEQEILQEYIRSFREIENEELMD